MTPEEILEELQHVEYFDQWNNFAVLLMGLPFDQRVCDHIRDTCKVRSRDVPDEIREHENFPQWQAVFNRYEGVDPVPEFMTEIEYLYLSNENLVAFVRCRPHCVTIPRSCHLMDMETVDMSCIKTLYIPNGGETLRCLRIYTNVFEGVEDLYINQHLREGGPWSVDMLPCKVWHRDLDGLYVAY